METLDQLAGARVLVVGINYAPEHTGIAPYTSQACGHLAAVGADVFVLAGVPHYPHWTLPASYRRRVRTHEQHGRVTVRRLRHSVPSRQSALTRSTYEVTFGLHVLAQRLPWRPDVVLAVTPSLLGSLAAAATARRFGVPLVLWVQDLMGHGTAQSGIAGGHRVSRVTHAIERRAALQASTVMIVSEAFRSQLQEMGVLDERIQLVPNWTHVQSPRQDRESVRQRLGWDDDEFIALHSGNMGLKQGLENIVEAARLASDGSLPIRFVLMGDGSQRAMLESISAGAPNVMLLSPADSDEFPDILAAADVLLVNERASAVDMSLPSKLTSYFSVGVPVVAAVPSGGGTTAEMERSGGGIVVPAEDPAALLEAVRSLALAPGAREALGQAGVRHAAKHLGAATSLGRLAGIVAANVNGRVDS